MTQHALVTGASTGIGRATVRVLIGKGWRVFAGVRKPSDADSLRQEFGDKVVPEILDVTDPAAIVAAAADIRAQLNGQTLNGLVNNAGMALGGPLALQPVEEMKRLFEVNVFGVVRVTQAMIPLLGGDKSLSGEPGRIVNITSVGGKIAPPFIGDYAMTKHAMEAFSESLRRELMLYGIDVIAIGPGAVKTPIWDKADSTDMTPYLNSDFAKPLKKFVDFFIADGRKGFEPEVIGEAVHTALTIAKPKVRYAVVPKRFVNWTLPTLLPKRVIDGLIAKQFGLSRKAIGRD